MKKIARTSCRPRLPAVPSFTAWRAPVLAPALAAFIALPAHAAEPSPADLVDALNGVFGQHAGARGSHAKGFCARGSFTPAPQARALTKAGLLAATSVPAELRFSIGGGNPAAPDKSRSVRGLSVRLTDGREHWDLVFISEPVFFAATPASFVSFLQARVSDPATKKPDPAKIAAHNARYPEGKTQPALLAAHAAPASYVTTPYFSNHAFRFVTDTGAGTWARLQFEPLAGTRHLTADEEKSLPADFLEDEFKARLAHGAATFDLYAQPAGDGDPLTDPSAQWSAGQPKILLGRLAIDHFTGQACDGTVYVPTVLPAGIEPSDDPVLKARAAAYAVSKARRLPAR
jgi:catalase